MAEAQQGRAGSERELGPLPGGHHGLSPEQVAESQRERLLAAVVTEVSEHDYQGVTITGIVKAATVANRVFYENFATKEEAFLAAFDAVHGHLEVLIREAVAAEQAWPDRVIAALRTTLDFFAAEPDLARLALVAPFTATPAIVTRFREAIAAAAPYLRAGRAERPEGAELPPSTEDGVLGGLVSITARSIFTEDRAVDQLLPDLVEFILSPYLGPRQARRLAAAAS